MVSTKSKKDTFFTLEKSIFRSSYVLAGGTCGHDPYVMPIEN